MDVLRNLSVQIPPTDKPRVVIIGGGFAGVQLARNLKNKPFQVVMLDRNNYHGFQPLLYQVATAGLEPDSIAGPLRQLFADQKDFHFRMARVRRIFPKEKRIETLVGDLNYDYLVIATGSRTNFFNNEDFSTQAFPLKQVPHALDLRSNLLQNFEKSVMSDDQEMQKRLMNVVIVGGGPTGVEVAGALAELRRHILPEDYPEIDFGKMEIHLIEGQPRLLNGMSDKAGKWALEYLERFDVDVMLGKFVQKFDGQFVTLNDGTVLETNTLVWAAGVKGNLIEGLPDSSVVNSRIKVDLYNRVHGFDDIYAVGDIAHMEEGEYKNGHPMLAPVAMQQGRLLAQNLVNMSKNKPLKPFHYENRGAMATIGRNKAVVDLPGNITFGGLFAWMFWMFIHIVSIIGFRNKLVIFSNWVWNYFTYDRGTRLIIRLFLPNGKEREKFGTY